MSPSPACEVAKQAGWWYTIDIAVNILSLSPTGYFCQQRQGGIPRPGAGHLFPLSPTGHFLSLAREELFRAPARVTFGRSPKSDQKVCLKPNAQPRRQPGQIQIVANGHTASHQRGTGGHRAGTRSVRGPLAGRRAGRGHDRRPHGHRGRTPHPEQESGLPHYGTRRRRHLPPRQIQGGGGESKGATPASDRAGAPRRWRRGRRRIE